jgi:hypothetical protein
MDRGARPERNDRRSARLRQGTRPPASSTVAQLGGQHPLGLGNFGSRGGHRPGKIPVDRRCQGTRFLPSEATWATRAIGPVGDPRRHGCKHYRKIDSGQGARWLTAAMCRRTRDRVGPRRSPDLAQRQRLPGGDGPGIYSRLSIVGNARKPAAQLDSGRELAASVECGTDRRASASVTTNIVRAWEGRSGSASCF